MQYQGRYLRCVLKDHGEPAQLFDLGRPIEIKMPIVVHPLQRICQLNLIF
jgi:hypothetical protein